jgi:hypothetical protein
MIKGIYAPDQVVGRMIEAELTQAELCHNAGIAPSTFTRWRSGRTGISLDVYLSIISAIEEAEAQVRRRRRRLKHQLTRYRASPAASGA